MDIQDLSFSGKNEYTQGRGLCRCFLLLTPSLPNALEILIRSVVFINLVALLEDATNSILELILLLAHMMVIPLDSRDDVSRRVRFLLPHRGCLQTCHV